MYRVRSKQPNQEVDEQGNVIKDSQDRPRIALGKAGANTIRALIKYLREKTEIAQVLPFPEDSAASEPQAEPTVSEVEPGVPTLA